MKYSITLNENDYQNFLNKLNNPSYEASENRRRFFEDVESTQSVRTEGRTQIITVASGVLDKEGLLALLNEESGVENND